MELSDMKKLYMAPAMNVIVMKYRAYLLDASGLLDGNAATKPAKAPGFDDWDDDWVEF